ncbi:16S rRNA (cytosine(1402)-N(4))-methyltransferase [Oceanidesulfovibrio indonesiensis]|uniref:Ribosomal RNA small subunit methyltransferase H n=1 Tax=Oceanidesulfovibrio indonesiensis TaxID=54767 RepID=A0A7M3MK29_9BACT|nr:16S rRNA (cytosine(1402)-N(4))-methyltransferase RsmH [Oceanidesulfovibrio indonesiensis]TVM19772.1 16S rRNA (cytosine(1402)-N(4))-methyltransferase [Oceanidesulfovibrio indonesiensis]
MAEQRHQRGTAPPEGQTGQKGYAHASVMVSEVLEYLAPKQGGRYMDGTLGLGGHAEAVLQAAGGCSLLGIDRDAMALETARQRLAPWGERVTFRQGSYSRFEEFMDELGWDALDGALLDLGVSSIQLDDAERGFSFLHDGPLDMRMGLSEGDAPAYRLVNKLSHGELKAIIHQLGEEPMGGRIARAIIEARAKEPIENTARLADIVEQAYPAKWRATARRHPATRTFQALRMAVNRELEELACFLEHIVGRLAPGGRVVVISFHSLEDRAVKHAFRDEAKGCNCPRSVPRCRCGRVPRLKILTKKPLTPSDEEVAANSRARSAKLRAAERLAGTA